MFDSWVRKIPWRRERLPLQYSGLENAMDCIVLGAAKSWTRLSDFHFTILKTVILKNNLESQTSLGFH